MTSLVRLIERFLTGGTLSRNEILYGLLLLGLTVATVQLIVMLVTRWGDRNASWKALAFSVLLHLSTGVGVVATHPVNEIDKTTSEAAKTLEKKLPEPIRLQDLTVRSDQPTLARDDGNTPVWARGPAPDELEFARTTEPESGPTPLSDVERERERTEVALATPSRPVLPDWVPDQPTPDPIERPDSRRPETSMPAETPLIELPEAFAPVLPSATNLRTSPVRRRVERPGDAAEELDRVVRRGAADRLFKTETPRDARSLVLPDPEAEPTLRPDGEAREPIVRTAPDLVPEIDADAGLNVERIGRGTGDEPPTDATFVRRKPTGGSFARRPIPEPNFTRSPIDPSRRTDVTVASRPRVFELPEDVPVPGIVRSLPTADSPRNSEAPALPPLYQQRRAENRMDIVRKNGGSKETEQAVEQALKWLASVQDTNGRWDSSAYGGGRRRYDPFEQYWDETEQRSKFVDRYEAGKEADTGVTGLCLLAFLGAGYTHEEGPYRKTVRDAIDFLIDSQALNGSLAGEKVTKHSEMYCHGIATYALAEAYGMSRTDAEKRRIRPALQKAIDYTISRQLSDGSWRYVGEQVGDMSLFGWQLMALRSAEISGLEIPREVNVKMIKFLNDRSLGREGGLAAYKPRFQVTAAMTAESFFCKQMFRLPQDHPAATEAANYLLDNLPGRETVNAYYWYYGTLAMFQHGGEGWTRWNDALKPALLPRQRTEGNLAGSWDPTTRWGIFGGRVYSTAIATLCLESYYRFLPLYKIRGQNSENEASAEPNGLNQPE